MTGRFDALVGRIQGATRRAREQTEKLTEEHRRLLKICTEATEAQGRVRAAEARIIDLVTGLHADDRAVARYAADTVAELEAMRVDAISSALRTKKRPALKAADEVRALKRDLVAAVEAKTFAETTLRTYEYLFPEMLGGVTDELDQGVADSELFDEDDDPVSAFLAPDEYERLTTVERNQLALDRYIAGTRRRSRWQVGRDYEMAVGYERQLAGAAVMFHGIDQGRADLGRDLIATHPHEIEIIQCKYWSQNKQIHENHIFQLVGTVAAARRMKTYGNRPVVGVLVTCTSLSPVAHDFARELGIRVEEQHPMGLFPRIKCNVSGRTGERIYHLPFDQQYDTVRIEQSKGEFIAVTVAEAEGAGFRRAWRWRG